MSNEPVVKVGRDGSKRWYLNGNLHRKDGPAVELPDGPKFWYLDGTEYTEYEHNFQVMMRYSNV